MRVRWLGFLLIVPFATIALAQEPPSIDQNMRVIQMDGHGAGHANPDQAFTSFAIETKGSTAQEAAAQNAQIAQNVFSALKRKVGATGKVETGGYSLYPLYTNRFGQNSTKIVDWTSQNEITVECDPAIAGNVLDVAQAAGVTGTSDTDANSGKATISLNVSAVALTATDAQKRSAGKARQLAESLIAKLNGKGTVKVQQGRTQAENEPANNQTQDLIGYGASNSITAETSTIDQMGSLIDAAIAAGATRANFVSFNLHDDSKARSDAVADACKDAQLKANAAAQALGLKIRRVMKVTSVGEVRANPVGYSASFQASVVAPTTPIAPGEITVPATVTVTYELE